MQIRWVELENIRSYVKAHIDFFSGVNFICGMNGAGKSTIIEAIGLAFFDCKPKDIEKYFLRYGSKNGKITLCFSIDEGTYRIVRRLGSAKTHSLFDDQDGLELRTRTDIDAFLKEKLRVAPEDKLETMFENMIGVRQGAFSAPFLLPNQARIDTFNQILGMEHYAKADRKARELIFRELERQLIDLQKQIGVLEGRLFEFDQTFEQFSNCEKQLMILKEESELQNRRLIEAHKAYQELLQQRTNLEQLKHQMSQIEKEFALALGDKKQLNEKLERARQAKSVIEKVQEAENRYNVAVQKRVVIEKRRIEKENLLRTNTELTGKLHLLQSSMEIQLRNIQNTLNELEKNEEMNIQDSGKCREVIQMNLLKEKTIEERLEKNEHALLALEAEKAKIQTAQSLFRKMEQQEIWLIELDEKIKQAESDCEVETLLLGQEKERLAAIQTLQVLMNDENRMREQIKFSQENLLLFESGQCPYTKEDCITVHDLEADSRAELDIQRHSLQQTMHKIAKAQKVIQELEQVPQKLSWIENQKRNLISFEEERLLRIKQIKEGLVQASDLFANLIIETSFKLKNEIDQLMNNFEKQNTALLNEKQELHTELTTSQLLSKQAQIDINTAKRKIDELNLQKVHQLDLMEKEKEKAVAIKILQEKLEKNESQLPCYAAVEQECLLVNRTIDENEQSHRMYIQEIAIATEFEPVQKLLLQAEESIHVYEEQIRTETIQLKQETQAIDQLNEEKILSELEEHKKLATEFSVHLETTGREFDELSARVANLRALQTEKQTLCEKERSCASTLLFSRQCAKIMSTAAERMAQMFRRQVSNLADQMYHALAQEPCKLVWADDYELLLQDQNEDQIRTRSFRSLSGGEQMSASLALRLSLLVCFSSLGIAFFDEPTANLDRNRRVALAQILPEITQSFEQVFIVSHDDTFDSITQNVISIHKNDGSASVDE